MSSTRQEGSKHAVPMCDMTLPKLTPKQRRFVGAYLLSGNATQAALEAGYSAKTARFIGSENLTKPNIKAHVDAAHQRQLARGQQRQDDICDHMRTLAYTDRCLMFDDDANMLPLSQWPQELRDCVENIEVVIRNIEAGDGDTDRVVKVKLSSKLDAVREVAKMEGRYPRAKDTSKDDEAARREMVLAIVLRGRDRWAKAIKADQDVIEGKTV